MIGEWLIYALLVLIIIVLIVFIWRMMCKKDDIKEGMIDYYTVESYLKSLQEKVTVGQYIFFYANHPIQLAQVQVFDMNGINVAINRTPTCSSTEPGSADVKITTDANINPRYGKQNVWTSGSKSTSVASWLLDLGGAYQISSIVVTGMTPSVNLNDTKKETSDATISEYSINKGNMLNRIDPDYISPMGIYIEVWKRSPNVDYSKGFTARSAITGYEMQRQITTDNVSNILTFPNAFNITRSAADTISRQYTLAALLNTPPQPEVYTIDGQYTPAAAAIQCNINGALLATLGQLKSASIAGASWTTPGWIKDDIGFVYNPYSANDPWYNKTTATATAQPICFGIKPNININSKIQKFNQSLYKQYDNNPAYISRAGSRFSMPDIQTISNNVARFYLDGLNPAVWNSKKLVENINTELKMYGNTIRGTAPKAMLSLAMQSIIDDNLIELFNALKSISPMNFLLESSLGPTYKDNVNISTTIEVFGTIPPGGIDEINKSINICKRIFLGSPLQIDSFVNVKYDPNPTNIKAYIRAAPGPNASSMTNPANFCRAEVNQEFSEERKDYVTVFADINQIYNNQNCNQELTTEALGLIPEPARKMLIKWIFDRKKRIMRYNYPQLKVVDINSSRTVLTYRNTHIWQKSATSRYINLGNPSKSTDNRPTTAESIVLGIGETIPNMQSLVGMKVYGLSMTESNLTITSNTGTIVTGTITLSGPTSLQLPPYGDEVERMAMISTTNENEMNAVKYMIPLTNNIDLTSEYNLNMIAQGFYEAMQGSYIMSNIYDVFSIGKTILDIRFDITKHVDIAEYKRKLTNLKDIYYTLQSSNVTQNIIDTARSNYEQAIRDMEIANTLDTEPAVTGILGRFFYTYDANTAKITITGFTLDGRAVTSFMPEMNCGINISTGAETGTISYKPAIVYTMNVPETTDCSNPKTLRRMIDDYIDAANTDLKDILKNANPSLDVTKGKLHVTEIKGSTQVSPTQCAITWKEHLWDENKNTVLEGNAEITRNALMTYSVNTADWFATNTSFDISGFKLFNDANVPACIFSATDYKERVKPRLDMENDQTKIRNDFIINMFNNGNGEPCYKTLPLYTFNSGDYADANASVKTLYKNSGSQAVIDYYKNTGIAAGHMVRSQQAITPLSPTIQINQPLPEESTLDSASDTCPVKDCQDVGVLYNLVDQFNSDPTQPGSIMRVTRAFTRNPYQCDVEVDINYDVNVLNGSGKSVKKGTFTYDAQNNEIPSSASLSGIKKETRAFTISLNTTDCSYLLNVAGKPGSGATIQNNLLNLYKPMEYATHFQETTSATLSSIFNDISGNAHLAATTAASILPTYRSQGIAALGNISNLGTCATAKCSDTVNLNAMIAYYNSKTPPRTKQINNILRVGTLDEKTCDITFQEDTLAIDSRSTYKIQSSQTSGLRFTMESSSAAPCSFTPTAMTTILPAPPADVIVNMNSVPSSAICSEVYGVSGTFTTPNAAAAKCATYGGVLATTRQLKAAQKNGADWSSPGFLADVSGNLYYPSASNASKDVLSASTAKNGGALCFGPKPKDGSATDVLPLKLTPRTWSSCPVNSYTNPNREVSGFTNYVNPERLGKSSAPPIRVSESTYPLNSRGFGLDSARNRDAPPLDTLYKEPLRQTTRPASEPGPMVLGTEGDNISPQKAGSYKYLRFKPTKTRDPLSPTVEVGKFRFFLGHSEIDMTNVRVTNPMGTWIGDIEDVIGPGYTSGWSDLHKKAIVFAFPYATMVNGFTWTTANPDKGVGGDPVQWKLEGSQNGVYWTVLRDQTQHNFPVTVTRFQELPLFRF